MAGILVPLDGSEASLRALRLAISRAAGPVHAVIHIVNVQPPIPASVGDFVGAKTVQDFHADEAEKVLAPARKLLDQAKVAFEAHWLVGSPGEAIANYCRNAGCREVVMGSRGLGRFKGLVLGSVATQVLHLVDVPVTLVK